jgi:hypothetical protein
VGEANTNEKYATCRTPIDVNAGDFSRFTGFESHPAKAKKREAGSSASRLSVVAERGAISFAQSGGNATSHPSRGAVRALVIGKITLSR